MTVGSTYRLEDRDTEYERTFELVPTDKCLPTICVTVWRTSAIDLKRHWIGETRMAFGRPLDMDQARELRNALAYAGEMLDALQAKFERGNP